MSDILIVLISVLISAGIDVSLLGVIGAKKQDNKLLDGLMADVAELKKQNGHAGRDASEENIKKIYTVLSRHQDEIEKLSNKVQAPTPPVPSGTSRDAVRLEALGQTTARLEQTIKALQGDCQALSRQVAQQQQFIAQQEKRISELAADVAQQKSTHLSQPPGKPEPGGNPEEEPVKHVGPTAAVVPDRRYLHRLLEQAETLNEVLLPQDYKKLINSLKKCLEEYDDDAEETMTAAYGAIKQCVFGSFTKVAQQERVALRKYLAAAGYQPAAVREGDEVRKYTAYFSSLVKSEEPCRPEMRGKIKRIQIQPYFAEYEDGGERKTLILKGLCVYYE